MLGGKSLSLVAVIALTSCSFALLANDIDHSGQDFAPSISPDGKYAAYCSYRAKPDDLSEIYIVEVESGGDTHQDVNTMHANLTIEGTYNA